MSMWVAYDAYGDLIASRCSYGLLLYVLHSRGYDLDDCLIRRVTP